MILEAEANVVLILSIFVGLFVGFLTVMTLSLEEQDMYNRSKKTMFQRELAWSIEKICTDIFSDNISSFNNNSGTDTSEP